MAGTAEQLRAVSELLSFFVNFLLIWLTKTWAKKVHSLGLFLSHVLVPPTAVAAFEKSMAEGSLHVQCQLPGFSTCQLLKAAKYILQPESELSVLQRQLSETGDKLRKQGKTTSDLFS